MDSTKLKSGIDYHILWKNCSELLNILFPGEFNCDGFLGIQLPSYCKWAGANTSDQLEKARRVVTYSWRNLMKKVGRIGRVTGCSFRDWVEKASRMEEGALRAVVAVGQKRRFPIMQHLTIFFYFKGKPEKLCSLGVNVGRLAMTTFIPGSHDRKMQISSPDKALIKMFSPEDVHVLAVMDLAHSQLEHIRSALAHLDPSTPSRANPFDEDIVDSPPRDHVATNSFNEENARNPLNDDVLREESATNPFNCDVEGDSADDVFRHSPRFAGHRHTATNPFDVDVRRGKFLDIVMNPFEADMRKENLSSRLGHFRGRDARGKASETPRWASL